MDIELRHLRAFVAVAEELNFTRAAERLFLAQQALSAQVRQLETRVGARLFDRTTRSVQLTPAGEALYSRARLLLADADDAVAAVRAVADSVQPVVVGFVAAVDHAAVAHALDRFAHQRPDVPVSVRFGELLDPTGGLRSGDADVAFTYGPFDTSGLVLHPIFDEPMGVAFTADHPLAAIPRPTIDDVMAEATFDFPAPDATWRDHWSGAAYRGGRAPLVAAQYRTLEGLVAALRAGLGVTLATRALVDSAGGDLVWRPLTEHPPLRHYVVHRDGEEREHVLALVDAVVATFADTVSA